MAESIATTTATISLKPPPSFLSLPAEVRNKIYTHLFHNARLGIATTHPPTTNTTPSSRIRPKCTTFCTCHFPHHILLTCRQLRHEATPMLLSCTTLEVSAKLDKLSALPASYLSSIPHAISFLDPRHLPALAHQLAKFPALTTLELRNITIFCKYHIDEYFMQEYADERMFDIAMFNLGRISPDLLKVCRRAESERGFGVLLGCQYVVTSQLHETVKAVVNVDTKEVLHKTRGPAISTRNAWAGFY